MILDLAYINKDFYIFNQVKFGLIYFLSDLNIISLYVKKFCYLVNILILTYFYIKLIVLIKLIFVQKKFSLCLASLLSLLSLRVFKNNIPYILINKYLSKD